MYGKITSIISIREHFDKEFKALRVDLMEKPSYTIKEGKWECILSKELLHSV